MKVLFLKQSVISFSCVTNLQPLVVKLKQGLTLRVEALPMQLCQDIGVIERKAPPHHPKVQDHLWDSL